MFILWYSATKIGIAAIDMEHGNIDTMLSMIISNTIEHKLIGRLIDAMINHFQSEENIILNMGRVFPEEHRAEHKKLTEVLLKKKQEWSKGILDALTLAHEIKQVLILHVAEFDKPLNPE